MSTSVDSRVATMKFDNKQFEQGAAQSLNTLGKLKQSMNFQSAQKGLDGLKNSASRFSLGNMGSEAEGVKSKFGAMQVAGVAALATVASKATSAGLSFAKSFTIGPILDGLHEYETNLQAIQTIQANTDRPLPEINKALQQLNAYSDQTIYNFGEMARNIGTFTAAGVDLQTSVSSIKGIANLAALSGSSSQQASTAMYQLSQAIASGKVGLQDWNSVVNAGMGGKKFQNALAQTGKAMGLMKDHAITLEGPLKKLKIGGQAFRQSISVDAGANAWLTSDILVNTLKTLDGRFSRAALSAQLLADGTRKYKTEAEITAQIDKNRNALAKEGVKYSNDQFNALMKMSDSAFNAATKVKTLGQVFDIAKETIGSGWSASFQNIFGNLSEAKKLFTGMSNSINNVIKANALARNNMLATWKKLGGRTDIIEGIKNVFKALGAILKPIHDAFRDIFPPTTGKQLADLSARFRKFTEGLVISKDTANDIRSVFTVLFKIIHFGLTVVGGIFKYFWSLGELLSGLLPGIMSIVGGFADLINGLFGLGDASKGVSGLFDHVIEGRAKLLKPIIEFVNKLLLAFGKLISSGADKFVDKIKDAVAFMTPYFNKAKDAVEGFVDSAKALADKIDFSGILADLKGVGKQVVDWFKGIFDGLDLGDAFSGLGDSIMSSLGKVDLGNMFSGFSSGAKSETKGIAGMLDVGPTVDHSKSKIEELKKQLPSLESLGHRVSEAWGDVLDAFGKVGDFLRPVGAAIGAAFGWLRAKIKDFTSGLGIDDALSVLNTGFFVAAYVMFIRFVRKFGGVAESMEKMFNNVGGVFKGLSGNLKAMQRDVNATAILKIAAAVAVLAGSIYLLSKLKAEEIAIGLGSIALLFVILKKALGSLTIDDANTKKAWSQAAQLTLLSTSLVALSLAILTLTAAIAILGHMDEKTLKQGLISIAAILAIVVTAAAIMSRAGGGAAILAASVAIGILSVSLAMFAATIKLFSKIDADTLMNGGLKIAAALIAIGIAMQFFPPTIAANAAGLVLVSVALIILAKGISKIAELDWGTVFKALGILAVVFATLGLTSVLLTPLIPVIAGLGGAILLFGIAVGLAGAGMFLFATGLALLAASGAAGAAALTGVIMSVVSLFPLIMHQIGLGMHAFAVVIKKEGPGVIQALGVVLRELLKEIAKSAPDFGKALWALLKALLGVIWKAVPQFIKTGFHIIMAFLRGIRDNAREMVQTGVEAIQKFLQGLNDKMDTLIQSGINTILKFIHGVAKGIRDNRERIQAAGRDIAGAIIDGAVNGLTDLGGAVIDKAKELGGSIKDGIGGMLKFGSPSKVTHQFGRWVGEGLVNGMSATERSVGSGARDLGKTARDSLKDSVSRISDILATDLNTTPTITPVLNLDQVSREASKMSSMLSGSSIDAKLSYSRAASVLADRNSAEETGGKASTSVVNNDFKYEQTIIAPKQPSRAEIYRDTKNLLSMAKNRKEGS